MSTVAEIAVTVVAAVAGPCFENLALPILRYLCSCFWLEDNIRELRAARRTLHSQERRQMSSWLSKADEVEGEFEAFCKSRCSCLPVSGQYCNICRRHGLSREAASLTNNMKSSRERLARSAAGDDVGEGSSADREGTAAEPTQIGVQEIGEGSRSRSSQVSGSAAGDDVGQGSSAGREGAAAEPTQVGVQEIGEGSGSNSAQNFQLDLASKIKFIPARQLFIEHVDKAKHWKWMDLKGSRFNEMAELLCVWWLEIQGNINISELSKNTTYSAYLVYNQVPPVSGFNYTTQKAAITVRTRAAGRDDTEELKVESEVRLYPGSNLYGEENRWKEMCLGDFNIDDFAGDGDVEISLTDLRTSNRKSGLRVAGIEVRPKHSN